MNKKIFISAGILMLIAVYSYGLFETRNQRSIPVPQAYSLSFESSGSWNISQLLGTGGTQVQDLRLTLKTELKRIPGSEPGSWLISFQKPILGLYQGDLRLVELEDQLREAWDQPFHITEDDRGLLVDLKAPDSWPITVVQATAGIMRGLQMQRPRSEMEWNGEETLSLGIADFRYAAEPSGDEIMLEKMPISLRQRDMTPTPSWTELGLRWEGSGQGTGRWSQRMQRWTSIDLDYTWTATRGALQIAKDQMRVQLKDIPFVEGAPSDSLALTQKSLRGLPLVARQRVAPGTGKKAWLELNKPGTLSSETEATLFRELRLSLDDPTFTVNEQRQILLNPELSDGSFSLALQALQVHGGAQARALLTDLIEADDVILARRKNALLALARADNPTVASEDLIRRLADDPWHPLHRSAGLSLGILADKLQSSKEADAPERHERLVKSLHDRYQNARDSSEQKAALDMIGNAGSPQSVPLLHEVLKKGGADLRDEAIMSLRLIATPEARALLWSLATHSLEPETRRSAAEALRVKPQFPADLDACLAVLQTELKDELRLPLMHILGSGYSFDPVRVRKTMDGLASNGSPEVQSLARSMIAGWNES